MKHVLIFLVKFYRKWISPMHRPCCRYIPTCSQYALQALEKYGALKGSWLTLKRFINSRIVKKREPGCRQHANSRISLTR